MDMAKYLALYLDESRNHLKKLKNILESTLTPSVAEVQEIFRLLHTLKGMSASMGYQSIATFVHSLENKVMPVKNGERPFDENLQKDLLLGLRELSWNFSLLEKGRPLTPALRIRSDVLDDLIDNLGELFVSNQRLQNALALRDLDKLGEYAALLSSELRYLHEHIISLRLTPLSFLTDRLPETAQTLARKTGKEVKLIIKGDEQEVDRSILEALDAPLIHLLRNAIDHGLESPEERKKAGKEPCGQITISAKINNSRLSLTFSDDGQGIDEQKVRQKALAAGLISAGEAAEMSKDKALTLIFSSGLSTSEKVSDISGRGVGLDAVKKQLDSLGGHLQVASEEGRGTAFTIDLPSALTLTSAFIIKCGAHTMAVPMWQLIGSAVVEESFVGPEGHYINFRGAIIPLYSLAKILNIPAPKPTAIPPFALVTSSKNSPVALAIDKVVATEELVIKPQNRLLAALPWCDGVALCGNGRPVLVLDLTNIVSLL